jgi:small subunit ribosomal protein S14
MPPRPNIRVLRDMKARQGVADNEISRRAYLYVARNQSLPAQVRYQAQLQLNTFGRYTRPTTVKNRCTATGRGRGVIGEFGLCRVRLADGLNRECGPVTGAWICTVPVPTEGARWRAARNSQGILVGWAGPKLGTCRLRTVLIVALMARYQCSVDYSPETV